MNARNLSISVKLRVILYSKAKQVSILFKKTGGRFFLINECINWQRRDCIANKICGGGDGSLLSTCVNINSTIHCDNTYLKASKQLNQTVEL